MRSAFFVNFLVEIYKQGLQQRSIKGGLPYNFVLFSVLEPWVGYCSQAFCRFFVPAVFAEIEVKIAFVLAVVESGRSRT